MITLQRPDPHIMMLIGENSFINDGDCIRPSLYARAYNLGGKKIIYHTLTVIGYSCVLLAVISKHKN